MNRSIAVSNASGPGPYTIRGARKKDSALIKRRHMKVRNEESGDGSVLFCEEKKVGTAHEKGTPGVGFSDVTPSIFWFRAFVFLCGGSVGDLLGVLGGLGGRVRVRGASEAGNDLVFSVPLGI